MECVASRVLRYSRFIISTTDIKRGMVVVEVDKGRVESVVSNSGVGGLGTGRVWSVTDLFVFFYV